MSLSNHWMSSRPGVSAGFTLIEILVTVIVLSIGLLGLAGLQATSLKFNSTAYQRSQATSLAYDIIDRMRANAPSAAQYIDNVSPRGALTTQDIQEWSQAITNTLPSGTGSIAQNGNIFTIIIQWDDDRDGTLNQSFQTDTAL